MSTVIRMPEVLAGSEEAAIQTWLVEVGQDIAVGSPLAEVETEKAIVEYAAEAEGTLLKLLVQEGVAVKVGDPIAVIGARGESVDDAIPATPATPAEPEVVDAVAPAAPAELVPDAAAAGVSTGSTTGTSSTTAAGSSAGGRLFASPLVRRLAKERGVDLATLTGTGPNGRIVRADLERAPQPAAASAPAAVPEVSVSGSAGYTDIPHTGMRRAIARRLTESKSTVPHFYVVADCRVDELVALRSKVNETTSVKVSLNDFVIKAAAAALVDVPEVNVTWGETATRRYDSVDMSVAVAIDGGLVTPVIRGVEKLTLTDITRAVADLSGRAREGRLKQHELEGGSFAVSSLGMYGVSEFSAIINPPQAGILAVGAARQQPIVVDGELAVGTIMTVTLSADHRVVDGALAAQWLAAFVKRIESPLGLLV
jgi:pyruvate dehydrogenase E2 component (dihydrolipoamide acetyltransferase)